MAELKNKVIELIKGLPDDVTVDDIIEQLHFKIQIDAGLKELDEGQVIGHEDVVNKMDKWISE